MEIHLAGPDLGGLLIAVVLLALFGWPVLR